jgi:hypothetical protein
MIPSPPKYINPANTACPKSVQYVALSTITNPVTQAAEVAVNSAVSNGVAPGWVLAIGNQRRTVPPPMRMANPPAKRNVVVAEKGSFALRCLA